MVLDVLVTPGEAVGAGTNLVLLADPVLGEVRTTVIEEDLADVQIGQPAELFFDARPDIAVQGVVDRRLPAGAFPGMTVDDVRGVFSQRPIFHPI